MYHDPDTAIEEDTDSPWLDDDPNSSSSTSLHLDLVAQQEWDKLSLRHSDAGYRDGITSGKNSRLQMGFDQGFALAAPSARDLGALRGVTASLLALLTTTSAAKHAGPLLDSLDPNRKERIVAECRAVVTALGKLDERKVLPVDLEAEEHAKSHAEEGLSHAMVERREMREMEEMLSGIGSGKMVASGGLEECRTRLEGVLKECGMEGLLAPRRG